MSAQMADAKQTSRGVPKALADAGECAENLYDAAKLHDWMNAGEASRS
jgi:hypothetical protein